MMHNCYKLFVNDRLFAIFAKESSADFVVKLLDEAGVLYTYEIRPAFVQDIGF